MPEIITYFSNIGVLELIGVLGFLCYIGAFGSVQVGLMDGNGSVYCLVNILAAVLVATSLTAEFNLASALIQGSWIIIGLLGLILRNAKSAPAHRPQFQKSTQIGTQL